MKPKECREDINIFRKWDSHRYQLTKIISEGRSAKTVKGSGAHVFKIKDTHSNREYILKYYNALKNQTRNYRDMYVSCRLSGLKGVPRVIAQGKTILPKQYGAKLQKKGYFCIQTILPGIPLSDTDIIFKDKNDALHISLQILKILLRVKSRIKDFQHYDIHPGNIMIDQTRNPPSVGIIDFDLAYTKQLKDIPDQIKWDYMTKGRFFGLFYETSMVLLHFLWKWYKNVFKLLPLLRNTDAINNVDIRNWLFITKVLFEKNKIDKKVLTCSNVEDCLKKNFPSKT